MMSLNLKQWRFILLLLAGVMADQLRLGAEEGENQDPVVNLVPAVRLEVQYTADAKENRPRHVLIFAGAERYSFYVPEGYRPDIAGNNQVRLTSNDSAGFIIVTIGPPAAADGVPSAETLRSQVMTNHAAVVVNKEHTMWLNQKAAPAVDYTWKTAQGLTRTSRDLVCNSAIGEIRINLVCSPEKFEACQVDLDHVLITFRPGKNSQFEFVTASKWP